MSTNLTGISSPSSPGVPAIPDRLTVFAWLWACQALVHQEFYSVWLKQGDLRGWAVTILATATLLRPSSLPLFCGMLTASIIYNVAKWPFVVNHILLESIINATILAAVSSVYLSRHIQRYDRNRLRDLVVARFGPVVTGMIVIMYWFAFIAKLNTDFVNPDVSCVTAMYGDLQRRLPFLPDTRPAHVVAIALTLLVEGLIPLLLTFRRTRHWAVLIGLPFHFVLGLVGHRTFSGLAFAAYSLLMLDSLTRWVQAVAVEWQRRVSPDARRRLSAVQTLIVTVGFAALIAADLAGQFRFRLGGVAIYQIPWLIWSAWSILLGATLASAIWMAWREQTTPGLAAQLATPGWIWSGAGLVVLIGLSPYLGLKTETCFTMYSNLRTEAEWNNHFFMPAWKLGPWQTDLVKITSTDHPTLKHYVDHADLITYFELRRIVSQSPPDEEFYIHYVRQGDSHVIAQTEKGRTHTAGEDSHPGWLGRLLYFRPIPTEVCMPCRH